MLCIEAIFICRYEDIVEWDRMDLGKDFCSNICTYGLHTKTCSWYSIKIKNILIVLQLTRAREITHSTIVMDIKQAFKRMRKLPMVGRVVDENTSSYSATKLVGHGAKKFMVKDHGTP